MGTYLIFGNLLLGLVFWVVAGKIGSLIWNKFWPKTYSECLGYLYGPLVFIQMLSTYAWLREE